LRAVPEPARLAVVDEHSHSPGRGQLPLLRGGVLVPGRDSGIANRGHNSIPRSGSRGFWAGGSSCPGRWRMASVAGMGKPARMCSARSRNGSSVGSLLAWLRRFVTHCTHRVLTASSWSAVTSYRSTSAGVMRRAAASCWANNRYVETGVTFGGRGDQLVIAEPARSADRVDVEVVARLAPAVQGGDLVTDRIGQAEHRSYVQGYRVVLAPIHAQVDVELQPVPGGHMQPRELRGAAALVDLEATPPQLVGHLVDGGAECGHVLAGGEQVNVLGRPLDQAVLADRAGPGEGEAVDAGEGDPGDLTLHGDLAACSGLSWLIAAAPRRP